MAVSKPQDSPILLLSVVIVNYRSWPDVSRLVGSLASSPRVVAGSSEILVVDNDSGQPVPEDLREPRDGVEILHRARNDGFSAGVNAGWRAARGAWLLVLNPDVVPDPGFLEGVERRIAAIGLRSGHPPGVIGFGLRNPDGSRQPSVGLFPNLFRTLRGQLIPRDRRKYQPDRKLKAGPVDWVTGACMLVNGGLLAEVGGMDEDFFLYYEEVALCRAARDRGWPVEYDPSLAVVHLRPLQNRTISPKMRVITRHGKLLYFRKHLPGWQFAALAAIVEVEALVRGNLDRLRGRASEARSWRAVARVVRLLKGEGDFSGRAVLELAEEAVEPPEEVDRASNIAHRTPHGSRRLQLRKDGPA